MLKTFFEMTDRNTASYFEGTAIAEAPDDILRHMGKYPVIFLSFKDTDGESAHSIISRVGNKIRAEYRRHWNLMRKTGKLTPEEDEDMLRFTREDVREDLLVASLSALAVYLQNFHEVAPVVLIDEYDAPIRRAWDVRTRDPMAYDAVTSFTRNLLSSLLKSTEDCSFACLTGIDRVAMAGSESGPNNLRAFGVLDKPFAQYFGFTHAEVRTLLDAYGALDRYEEVCNWYQGYRLGNEEMFNPVSVLNYLNEGCTPKAYWPLTSLNATIGDTLEYATPEVLSDVSKLAAAKTVQSEICGSLVYPDLPGNPEAIFTLLLGDGYLTTVEQETQNTDGVKIWRLEVPNRELLYTYRREVYGRVAKASSADMRAEYARIRDAIMSGSADGFQQALRKLLLTLLGPNDVGGKRKEDAYHLLLAGLLAPLMGNYILTSNGNAGEGRFDISLTPGKRGDPAVIIEVKAAADRTDKQLHALAKKALGQIDEKHYTAQAGWENVGRIFKYGVAFSKKHVQVVWAEE